MKISVKAKQEHKAKPGDLLSTHIRYGANGSASVEHTHEPEVRGGKEPWSPGPTPLPQNFSTRAEALHHAAQHAGVNSTMEDEEEAEENEADEYPDGKGPKGRQPKASGGGVAGKSGLPAVK